MCDLAHLTRLQEGLQRRRLRAEHGVHRDPLSAVAGEDLLPSADPERQPAGADQRVAWRNARHAYAVVRTKRRNARASRSDSSKPSSVATHSSSSLRIHWSFMQESPPPVDAVNGSRARIASSTMVAASTTSASVHSYYRPNISAVDI